MTWRRIVSAMALFGLYAWNVAAAPEAELWSRWEAYNPSSQVRLDHGIWNTFLQEHVTYDQDARMNLLAYRGVEALDQSRLVDYIRNMEEVAVSGLSRPEQLSFWINLYNAVTVSLILENYPLDSIRDIKKGDQYPGGPWGTKLLKIEGQPVSLNDIEHRILRPIWRDPRIHYAVNCASMSCPALQPVAYTAGNTEKLLEEGARAYINSARGVEPDGQRLWLSSIYQWFLSDFGGTEQHVLAHLKAYAAPTLASELDAFHGSIKYRYDWSLNAPEPR